MTAPTARIGLGTTIEFLTTGAEYEVTKSTYDGVARTAHETTHLGTSQPSSGNHGSRTYIPGKVTAPGTFKLEGHFNAGAMDIIEGATERVRVSLPIESGYSTADKYECDGFVVGVGGIEFDPDGKIMQTLDIQFSGQMTYTAAT